MEMRRKTAELATAKRELQLQNRDKQKRAAELVIANKELAFQKKDKQKRADELLLANIELHKQNMEKEKRAAELTIANEELIFQNLEKEARASELAASNLELIKAKEQFKLVVESAPVSMLLVNCDGLITLVNDQTEKLFGYHRSELIGRELECLVPEHIRWARSTDNGCLPEIVDPDDEVIGMRKDGVEFPLELRLKQIDSTDGGEVLVSITDITERRILEVNKLKSDFLANMSHELRTPLNAVLGFSELLIDKRIGDLNPKQLEYLNDIHTSGRHLLGLINNVLDIAKIEAGKMDLVVETFALDAVIDEVVHTLKAIADKRSIRINLQLSESIGDVSIDKNRLRQILYNLLSNAIKFSHKGGGITVETLESGDTFVLKVHDEGIGIAASNLKRLFIPFVQLETGLARRIQGSGLGLSVTKTLVDLHDGELEVESTLGKGTTFIVRLPVKMNQ